MSANALRSAATGTAEKEKNPLAAFSNFMEKFKPQLALALPKHLTADRMARLALTEFSKSPKLQECDARTIAGSIMVAGQLGLEIGVNGQGFLVPYGKTCTFVPGWKGLQDLANRSGRATTWTGAVFEGDDFDYQLGDSPYVRHRPGDETDPAKLKFVYAIGRVKGGDFPIVEVWRMSKIWKHRDQYNKVGKGHYSFRDPEMYARKIPLLQVLKYVPSSIELAQAMEISTAADEGRGTFIDGDGLVNMVDTGEDTGERAPPAPPAASANRAAAPKAPAPVLKGNEAVKQYIDGVEKAKSRDLALETLDLARTDLPADDMATVTKAFHGRWGD